MVVEGVFTTQDTPSDINNCFIITLDYNKQELVPMINKIHNIICTVDGEQVSTLGVYWLCQQALVKSAIILLY